MERVTRLRRVVDDVFGDLSIITLLVLAVKAIFHPAFLIDFNLQIMLLPILVFGAARAVLS